MNKIVSILLICCLFACGTGSDVPAPPSLKLAKDIQKINFFLDASASMEGYIKGATNFSKIIPSLLVNIENKIEFKGKSISISFVADSIIPYKKSTKDFINDLATTVIAKDNSSEMNKMIEMVTDKTDVNDISLFVSDCIMSYPDKDIKAESEINKNKAEGGLKPLIQMAFSKLNKKGICATVYGFNSNFNEKCVYYDYQNKHNNIPPNIKRPFYIWAVGNKVLLQKFNKQLNDLPSFKPELSMSFGLFEEPISKFDILYKTNRIGEWEVEDNSTISDIQVTKKQSVKFAIALDLSPLPEYAKDANYIKSKLQIEKKECVANVFEVKKIESSDVSKAAPKEKEYLEKATHIITFELTDLYKKGSITASMPLQYDLSYREWSTMDDKNVSSISGKTFAFQFLIDGVRDSYENNNAKFISFSVNLNK